MVSLCSRGADFVVALTPGKVLNLARIDDAEINIDGDLTESTWHSLPAYDEFLVTDPDTLAKVRHATRVRFFYNQRGLYFGIDMDQPTETLIKRLSGRDNRKLNRDSINITLDTSGEGRYGYWFGISLGDSLLDGTVLPERQFSNEWDGAWYAATQTTKSGWSAEFLIPWGTLAMPKAGENRRLGLFMSRKVAYVDERWGWPALPNTIPKFMSALQPINVAGVAPKQQLNLFPFTAVGRDRIDDQLRYRIGADVFWRPSTNFQLTATANPDFGNVESDDVVINLTATETFFPEKRLFFVEGQGVFVASPRADTRGGGVGNRGAPTTLVDTRRIGGKPRAPNLGPDETVSERELIQPADLLGAVKITGQAGGFRYGVLAAFEDDVKFDAVEKRSDEGSARDINLYQDGSDYGVFRLMYENSSNGYRAVGILSTAVLHKEQDAKTHGLDAHYLSPTGKMKIDGQVFMSDIDGKDNGIGGFIDFEYTIRKGVSQRLGFEFFDENVDINDLGFLQRNDNFRIRSAHTRTSSNLSWARDNQFDARGFVQRNRNGLFTGGGLILSNRTTFHNLSRLTARLGFLPKSYDDLNSFGNGTYRIEGRTSFSLDYNSNSSKTLSFGLGAGFTGENLGGTTVTGNASISWRPNDRFSVELGLSYEDRDGWLLHQGGKDFTTFNAEQWQPVLSTDYFISARQQLRLSLQGVGIRAREDGFFRIPDSPGDLIPVPKPAGPPDDFGLFQLSLQVRYRWEIAPLSDLFVVYTRIADRGQALGNEDFSDLFSDAYNNPISNVLVVKIRYRFGS